MFESVFPPGAGAFVHRHRSYEEAFYVLDGEIEYALDDRPVTASPGTTVFVPAGVVHAFKNVGNADARHLVIYAPVEVLQMIEDLGQARPDQIAEILARYDSELVEPR